MKTELSIKKVGIKDITKALEVTSQIVKDYGLYDVNVKIVSQLDWERSDLSIIDGATRVFEYDLEISGVQSERADV